MYKKKEIKVFDTTLRDGQQCPGAAMSFNNNIRYFKLASKLKVDVVEAGFPAASGLDFEIVKTIAEESSGLKNGPVIAALCQLREEQVLKTIEALKPATLANKARLHTYVPVDPQLMKASLGSFKQEKIVNDVFDMVKIAREAGVEVQFSPEGYSRMGENFDFTLELIMAAVEAGATVINCPDTIGGASSLEGAGYFVEHMKKHSAIIENTYPDKQITWSVHCHNDFGLAVQNTVNALFDGPATQFEGCINGIGERAGNASIEQIMMIINQFGANRVDRCDRKEYSMRADLNVIQEISDFVSEHMLSRQPHWPITGENAARHSSGGHTNAILKNPMAYQPFDPEVTGKEISFTFGPLSGGNHAKSIIEKFGFICSDKEKASIAQFIKTESKERRKGISDNELIGYYIDYRKPIRVNSVDYSKVGDKSSVTITGEFFGKQGTFSESCVGKNSALQALKILIEKEFGTTRVIHNESYSDSTGINAMSVAKIILEDQSGLRTVGVAKSHDIEISALEAFIDAVNKSFVERHFSVKGLANRETRVEEGVFGEIPARQAVVY